MSQIGRMPILVPEGVEISKKSDSVSVKGKLGTLDFHFDSNINILYSSKDLTIVAIWPYPELLSIC